MLSGVGIFLKELKRRKIYRVAAVYAAVAFVVVQAASLSFSALHIPSWAYTLVVLLAGLGFPIALVLAWALETKPDGPRRDTDESTLPPGGEPAGSVGARPSDGPTREADETLEMPSGPSIAVLPFRNLGGDRSHESFAEAMTSAIMTGLTRCSTLFVVSSGDTDRSAEKRDEDPVGVGRRLGVRYVLQGSVNRAGPHLRVTARLTDVGRNVQIWSGDYDRALTSATDLFEMQDDIREQIVATLSDFHGIIYSEETRRNVPRSTESLSAYECLSVALAYDKYLSEDYHLRARESLERAVELDPGFDAAWAHLSWIYTDEVVFGYNPLPGSMERALDAARRAIKLAPTDYHDRWLLSRVYYFSGERDLFVAEAERSLELNSSDGTTIGLIGGYLILSGQLERGTALVEKAKLLNPRHPDYFYLFLGLGALIEERTSDALRQFQKLGAVDFPLALILLAATSAMAGRVEEASRSWERLRERRPAVTVAEAVAALRRFAPYQPALVERVEEALRAVDTEVQPGPTSASEEAPA